MGVSSDEAERRRMERRGACAFFAHGELGASFRKVRTTFLKPTKEESRPLDEGKELI